MKFIGNIDTIRFMIESSRKDAYIEWDGVKNKIIGYIFFGINRTKYRQFYVIDFEEKYNIIEFKIKKGKKWN